MRLTPSEKLRLGRRRLGLSQFAMAGRLGMSRDDYARMERGEKDLEPFMLQTLKHVSWKDLTAGERCFIYRFHAGYSTARIAKDMRTHRVAIHKMETDQADATDLICYWEQ